MDNNKQHNEQNIAIADLQPGMVIVRIIAQNGPVKIRKSGLVSSIEMVQGLMEMGVQEVQIDPAQTVELEPQSQIPSTMQRILMDGQRGQTLDNSLSDQFNRSLFLPSVSGIPSRWQYHARHVLMVAVVVCGGLGLGWTAATYEQWRVLFTEPMVANAPLAVAVKDQPAQPVEEATSTLTPAPLPTVEVAPPVAQPPRNSVRENVSREVAAKVPAQKSETISPDLLKKFNQAVAQLGDRQDVQTERPLVPSNSSIARIDQLPAWVLAELPPLAFSAHMYSSDYAERWVTLNDTRLYEGDWYDNDLKLEAIEPQRVILNYQGQQFSMNALSQW